MDKPDNNVLELISKKIDELIGLHLQTDSPNVSGSEQHTASSTDDAIEIAGQTYSFHTHTH